MRNSLRYYINESFPEKTRLNIAYCLKGNSYKPALFFPERDPTVAWRTSRMRVYNNTFSVLFVPHFAAKVTLRKCCTRKHKRTGDVFQHGPLCSKCFFVTFKLFHCLNNVRVYNYVIVIYDLRCWNLLNTFVVHM